MKKVWRLLGLGDGPPLSVLLFIIAAALFAAWLIFRNETERIQNDKDVRRYREQEEDITRIRNREEDQERERIRRQLQRENNR